MTLLGLQWGGAINSHNSSPSPVEIWTNSLHLTSTEAAPDAAYLDGLLTYFRGFLDSWFEDPHTYIDATVSLDWVKLNQFNVVTGKQITDPTVEYLYDTPLRGYVVGDYSPPTSQSYRVSLDNGTRNRRAHGGFFVPRAAASIAHGGRWISGMPALAAAAAQSFIVGMNTSATCKVGVYSRREEGIFTSTRVRVGDVPDNISNRRNALREAYAVASL